MRMSTVRCSLFKRLSQALALVMLTGSPLAHAVPSYARQTGMSCASCHTTIPELNALGRQFKLLGYTMASADQIKSPDELSIDLGAPLSAMMQVGYTHLAKADPGVQNDDIQFPQQLSLFYAGRIAPDIGMFSQLTYDQESDKFNWDNVDIRYAKTWNNLVYGLTLNNAPTVEDPWNSTLVWGFPWESSATAPTPAAAPLIDMLAQDSVGLGAYGMWNSMIYGDVTLYRSAHLGEAQPSSSSENTIHGVAPYWRLAWTHPVGDATLMVGTHGMVGRIVPSGLTGPRDEYTDVAVDTQYEQGIGDSMVTAHASYLRERQRLDASLPGTGSTSTGYLRVDGTFHYHHRASFSLGMQEIRGDDTAFWGTANGSPDSTAFIGSIGYLPWLNTKFVLQYTAYTKFDGATHNYDGAGRDAADNDALYMLAWFVL